MQTPLKQADAYICEYNYTPDMLEIERLSGHRLPMEQCYIKLSIVKETYGRDSSNVAQSASQVSLASRLKIESPALNLQVKLRDLFQPRTTPEGEQRIRRVIIRGRAGVGKTTLCKKVVFEFFHRRLWNDLFDRLLWVPLRHLKERLNAGTYNLGQLFCDEYFSNSLDREEFAEALWKTCGQADGGRTLFLLDGLDEILNDISRDGDMHQFLAHLLKQPNVIVTSRPSTTLSMRLGSFDLELETIGFDSNQVDSYIRKVEPQYADAIRSFLRDHALVRDLVRIPIQLDALCHCWQDVSEIVPETMTDLYRAIERSLWKKDILQLKKRVEGQLVTESDIHHPSEVRNIMRDEIILLETLAFTGLYNDIIAFDASFQDLVARKLLPSGKAMDRTLAKVSYLRTSESSNTQRGRTYHFLHLTFQEYFAARYLVRGWRGREQIKCLRLDRSNVGGSRRIHVSVDDMDARSFFRQHKYSARYDIVWRFVVGLLASPSAEEMGSVAELLAFFEAVDTAPLDLLGPTHHRLMMHCLSEVPVSDVPASISCLRQSLEERLSKCLVFQCTIRKAHHRPTLAHEREFPATAFEHILRLKDPKAGRAVLDALSSGGIIRSKVVAVVIAWLRLELPHSWVMSIFRIATRPNEPLGLDALKTIAGFLQHEDFLFRQAAVRALGNQSDLPLKVLNALAKLIADEEPGIRQAVVEAFGGRWNLQEKGNAALDHTVWADGRAIDSTIPRRQRVLPPVVVDALVASLMHQQSGVRLAAAWALQSQSHLSPDAIDALKNCLKNEDTVSPNNCQPAGYLHNIPDKDEVTDVRLAAERDCPPQKGFSLNYGWNILKSVARGLRLLTIHSDAPPKLENTTLSSMVTNGQATHFMDEPSDTDHLTQSDIDDGKIDEPSDTDNLTESDIDDEKMAYAQNPSGETPNDILSDLCGIRNLSRNVPTAVELNPDDRENRVSAAELLVGPSNLSELLNLPKQVFSDHEMLSMLVKRDEFYRVCLRSGKLERLVDVLLQASFLNHVALYLHDGNLCIEAQIVVHREVFGDEALLEELAGVCRGHGIPSLK